MAKTRASAGFTLIEIIVALAIVAITTSFAISSYRRHIARSQRLEAVHALLAGAAEQEKFHLAYGHYADRLDAPAGSDPPGIPVASMTPRGYYQLRVETADAVSYRLVAERTGSEDDSACFILSIDESGRRRATDGAARDTTAQCW